MVTFDPDGLRARVAELERELGQPGFWDDQQHAAGVSAEHSRLSKRLERYDHLRREYDDARELLELDESLADDVAQTIAPLRRELERVQEDALFSGEYDGGDAVVTIQSDAGGTDAQDWAEIVLRMYLRWAAERGFQTEVLETSPGEEYGIKSATFTVRGHNAYGLLSAERGVHRLVRISPFDAQKRRHTSFASLDVIPALDEEEAEEVDVDEADLRIDVYRSSGPGGQGVNTTDSAVRITHLPTGIVVSCQNERSQLQNRATAMGILKARLAELERRERDEQMDEIRGERKAVDFGSQIRSYVLAPYQMVKDHRTNEEVGDPQRVLDGDLDRFIEAELRHRASS